MDGGTKRYAAKKQLRRVSRLFLIHIMEEITLQALLEAGCHFGHKKERWHPKAKEFIYTEKDGIHIINLEKTKEMLERACSFVEEYVAKGNEVIFVGTKRQAKSAVKDAATRVNAPYFIYRWIGGFLTNWDHVEKNIEKIIRLEEERTKGDWKKYPKHEQVKLDRYLKRLKVYYEGVLKLAKIPNALYIIDIRKEKTATREAVRMGIPIISIVDTNTDPTLVAYPIPANDDAVGSITYITNRLAEAYKNGIAKKEKIDTKKLKTKDEEKSSKKK